jgi:hypothetical protein
MRGVRFRRDPAGTRTTTATGRDPATTIPLTLTPDGPTNGSRSPLPVKRILDAVRPWQHRGNSHPSRSVRFPEPEHVTSPLKPTSRGPRTGAPRRVRCCPRDDCDLHDVLLSRLSRSSRETRFSSCAFSTRKRAASRRAAAVSCAIAGKMTLNWPRRSIAADSLGPGRVGRVRDCGALAISCLLEG